MGGFNCVLIQKVNCNPNDILELKKKKKQFFLKTSINVI